MKRQREYPKVVKIAILQINPRLANPEFNGSEIEQRYQEAVAGGAEIVVTPEMHVAGYIPNDRLWDPGVRYRIQAEREACAVVCERLPETFKIAADEFGYKAEVPTAENYAAAIRARGDA